MRQQTRRKPPHVQRAVLRRDSATLSVWGKKGAEAAKEAHANNATEAEYYREKAVLDERRRKEQANEHIVPIDPDEKEEPDAAHG